jgi:hypothetical protein
VPRQSTTPEQKRVYNYRYRYGLTVEEYEKMLAAQDGKCAICRNPPKTRRLSVDHDHDTGAVRQLLCHPCNHGIAHLEDPFWFANATDYLDRHHPERTLD